MATHSSILGLGNPRDRGACRAIQSMELQRVRNGLATEQQQQSVVYEIYLFMLCQMFVFSAKFMSVSFTYYSSCFSEFYCITCSFCL